MHQHHWGYPTRLPRGTAQECSCGAWRFLEDGAPPEQAVVLSAAQLERAEAFLRTEDVIRALPEPPRSDA